MYYYWMGSWCGEGSVFLSIGYLHKSPKIWTALYWITFWDAVPVLKTLQSMSRGVKDMTGRAISPHLQCSKGFWGGVSGDRACCWIPSYRVQLGGCVSAEGWVMAARTLCFHSPCCHCLAHHCHQVQIWGSSGSGLGVWVSLIPLVYTYKTKKRRGNRGKLNDLGRTRWL